MAAFGGMLQQLMQQMRARGGGMQGRPAYQPGVSPAQQSFMQRYGGGQNVTMADGSPQVIPQSMGNQYANSNRFASRMQRYQPQPQQDPYGGYGGTFGGPSGRQQGKIQMPMDPYGTFGMGGAQGLAGPWQGDPRNNPMTRGRGGLDPKGPHARLAGNMTSGLRNMMNQNRMKRRGRNQPTTGGGKGGGTLTRMKRPRNQGPTRGGSRRGLGGIIKRRNQPSGPIKGGLLGGKKSATKTSQRGAFEGVLR